MAPTVPPTQQTGREEEQGSDQCENCPNRDTDQPQWQRQQPDEREKNQRQQRQRPAKHKQNAPPNEQNQNLHIAVIVSFLCHKLTATRRGARLNNSPPHILITLKAAKMLQICRTRDLSICNRECKNFRRWPIADGNLSWFVESASSFCARKSLPSTKERTRAPGTAA